MTDLSQGIDIAEAVALVVIGRNEGERLVTSLSAISDYYPENTIVYVDSGSTDDSVEFATSIGAHVVRLDEQKPFTAARARNVGFRAALELKPQIHYVQFLDGDCEIIEGWLERATKFLELSPEVAIASGLRQERFPERSVYNAIMNIEWNSPPGQALAVPGDMCVTASVFSEVGGFTEDVIAAEDDDLCIRVRTRGYEIVRLDARMSLHDADMTKLSQWYKRTKRGGYGYADVYWRHRNDGEHYFRRQLLSVGFWGLILPLVGLSSIIFSSATIALFVVVLYLAAILRTARKRILTGDDIRIAFAYAALIYSGKFAEFSGVMEYVKRRLSQQIPTLIEYK